MAGICGDSARSRRAWMMMLAAVVAACGARARPGAVPGGAPGGAPGALPVASAGDLPVASSGAASVASSGGASVAMTAVVRGFAPHAVWEHYEDGGFASYHVSRIEILSPEHLAGRTLGVLHDAEPAPASPWRQVGARLCFHVREADLVAEDITLFAGAFSEPCAGWPAGREADSGSRERRGGILGG